MKRSRIRHRNPERAEAAFVRNFLSEEYVDFTRREPCIFCRSHVGVRTAHVLEGRKMGGCGGDWRASAPVCFQCDTEWAQRGAAAFLAARGLTMEGLAILVQAHHIRYTSRPKQW